MAREKKSMIGFDPLAWLDDEHKDDKKSGSKKEPDQKAKPAAKKEDSKSSKSKPKEKAKMITLLGHTVDETSLLKGYSLAAEVLDEAVTEFYAELFEQYPEVKPLFEHTNEKAQAAKLSSALKLLFDNLDNEDALNTALTEMGERHQKYGALPEHYPVVAELLIGSFKKLVGRKWTKAITSSWQSLLTAVAETMCAAYVDEVEETKVVEDLADVDTDGSDKDEAVDSVKGSGKPVLQLNAIQDISKSQVLKNDLLALVNDSDDIDIDGSEVERIDGTALQLLCSLFIYAKQNNLIISWIDPSENLIDSAKILGLESILELTQTNQEL